MTEEAKKEYVVVFDQIGVHDGEFSSQGPGMHPVAISEDFFRGDTVKLNAADAKRHLASGAVIEKSDKRAKLIEPNPETGGGVRRAAEVSLAAVPLEETEAATAGGSGAKRGTGGKLGTKAELEQLTVLELKALAAQHGVTVERGDKKPDLAAKLAKVKPATAGDAELNPGQESDESPPPEDQPDTPPDE